MACFFSADKSQIKCKLCCTMFKMGVSMHIPSVYLYVLELEVDEVKSNGFLTRGL